MSEVIPMAVCVLTNSCTSQHYSNMQILRTTTHILKARDITSHWQFRPQLRRYWNTGQKFKVDPLQLLGEENLYCSRSHICQDIDSLFLGLVGLGFFLFAFWLWFFCLLFGFWFGVFFCVVFCLVCFLSLFPQVKSTQFYLNSRHFRPYHPWRVTLKIAILWSLKNIFQNASHSFLCKHELSEIAKHMNY